jgi:hypothetical protein
MLKQDDHAIVINKQENLQRIIIGFGVDLPFKYSTTERLS